MRCNSQEIIFLLHLIILERYALQSGACPLLARHLQGWWGPCFSVLARAIPSHARLTSSTRGVRMSRTRLPAQLSASTYTCGLGRGGQGECKGEVVMETMVVMRARLAV